MPVTDPEISFNVNDRGGEYYEKLQNLAAAISAIIDAHNSLESGALSDDDLTTVGQNLVAIPTPGGPSFMRVNDDGTISMLTAAEFLAAIGASSGMANPMTTAGDVIVAGTSGTPTRVAKGDNNTIFAVDNAGTLGYQTGFCGYGSAITLTNTDDINTVVPPNTPHGNALYRWTASSVPASLPSGFGAGYMLAMSHSTTQQRRQMLFQRDGTRVVNRFTANAGASWTVDEYVMDAPINGKSYVRKDGAWVESSGGGISTAPVQTFTSANEVSNNITVTCDCTTHNHHPLDFNGSPLPSTAGSYIINLTNLPTSTTELVVGHIAARRIGRKSTVTIQASGFTVAWLATPSFQSGTTGIDYIQYKIDPLFPTVLRLSQVYSRSS